MGAMMKTGRYMTTPAGAGRAQKKWNMFNQRFGGKYAKRGIDMSALGKALGFANQPPAPVQRNAGLAPTPGGGGGGILGIPVARQMNEE